MECHKYRSHLSHNVEKSEEDKKRQRKRNLLLLILDYLQTNGYLNTVRQLKTEVGASIADFVVCDNVNLETILQDFETYYSIRYQTHVHIVKKIAKDVRKEEKYTRSRKMKPKAVGNLLNSESISNNQDITAPQLFTDLSPSLLHPLGPYSNLDLNNEWRVLAELVCKEILVENPNVTWGDVIGHDHVKQCLKEALVYPMKYPDLYSVVKPWRGLFLYGPTGTGKTLLAKAAATECDATFFAVSPSSFTSKWRGESEKLIKVLFALAEAHAPSVIFIDEIDSLMTQRFAQEHEASRRFKSELLSQIEGLKCHENQVFILAASNFPWDIDFAMLRRLEQRIYVPLPDRTERQSMLERYLPPKIESGSVCIETNLEYENISASTNGYSGSDLQVLSKEVKMECIRNAVDRLESVSSSSIKMTVPVIQTADVIHALSKIKPIHLTQIDKYKEFTFQFGSL